MNVGDGFDWIGSQSCLGCDLPCTTRGVNGSRGGLRVGLMWLPSCISLHGVFLMRLRLRLVTVTD